MTGLLTSLFTGRPINAGTPAADHDFWYRPLGETTLAQAGVYVDPETAMRVSAVYACVAVLAQTLASLPLLMYRRREDGGKDRAPNHPLTDLLHDGPNAWQTSFEWCEMGMGHLLLRGNFYNRIVSGPRGFADQLVPLHPDRTTPKQLPSRRIVYTYRPPEGGEPETYTQDEIFHVRGLSTDGVTGVSVLSYACDSIGLAIAQDRYAGKFYANHASPGLVIKHPAKLGDLGRENLRKSWEEYRLSGAHKTAVLEEGMDIAQLGLSNRDAQFIETRKWSVTDIARWFRVPPHMIGDLDRATFSNIEMQSIEFVIYTMLPWFRRWEQAIARDLILVPETYFAEFLIDALLRGDIQSRYTAYSVAIQNGFMSENEVRARENLNPWPGLDEPRRSVNQDRGGDPTVPRQTAPARRPAPARDDEDEADARARLIVLQAAAAAVQREIAAIRRWAPRYASDPAGWREWTANFYGEHVDVLTDRLALDRTAARRYGAEHCGELLDQGLEVLGRWERDAPAALAAMALGGGR